MGQACRQNSAAAAPAPLRRSGGSVAPRGGGSSLLPSASVDSRRLPQFLLSRSLYLGSACVHFGLSCSVKISEKLDSMETGETGLEGREPTLPWPALTALIAVSAVIN